MLCTGLGAQGKREKSRRDSPSPFGPGLSKQDNRYGSFSTLTDGAATEVYLNSTRTSRYGVVPALRAL